MDTFYGVSHQLFCLFGSFTVLLLACRIVCTSKSRKKRADTSFFIFAFHTVGPILVAHNILKAIPASFRNSDMGGAICWILTVIIAVIIMEVVYYILRRYAPPVLRVLSGNRT